MHVATEPKASLLQNAACRCAGRFDISVDLECVRSKCCGVACYRWGSGWIVLDVDPQMRVYRELRVWGRAAIGPREAWSRGKLKKARKAGSL